MPRGWRGREEHDIALLLPDGIGAKREGGHGMEQRSELRAEEEAMRMEFALEASIKKKELLDRELSTKYRLFLPVGFARS